MPVDDPVVFAGRLRVLPGMHLNAEKCKSIFARSLKRPGGHVRFDVLIITYNIGRKCEAIFA
jgi:hypothetical protein